MVWFAYTPDRKGIHPQTHLANFSSVLHADAYAGFNVLFATGKVQEAACWAHARRKFYDLHEASPSAITVERFGASPSCTSSKPTSGGNHPINVCWRDVPSRAPCSTTSNFGYTTMAKLSRKSETTAAIPYGLNLWRALVRYCEDGVIEIDNSAAERALRGVALGRRNYLFAGADSGGERAASI